MFVLEIGDATLEEWAPNDTIWGTGRNGPGGGGRNLLGKCIEEVRDYYNALK